MNEIPSSFQLNIFFGEKRGWGPSEKKEKTSVIKKKIVNISELNWRGEFDVH